MKGFTKMMVTLDDGYTEFEVRIQKMKDSLKLKVIIVDEDGNESEEIMTRYQFVEQVLLEGFVQD